MFYLEHWLPKLGRSSLWNLQGREIVKQTKKPLCPGEYYWAVICVNKVEEKGKAFYPSEADLHFIHLILLAP